MLGDSKRRGISLLLLSSLALSSCSSTDEAAGVATAACTLTEIPGLITVTGASSANHDATVTVTKSEQTLTGTLIGLEAAAPASVEVSTTFTIGSDLGVNGSVTLVAQPTSFPDDLTGSFFPILVSLHDGTNELVNLKRAGAGGDCAQSGYFSCVGSSCTANSSCTVTNTGGSAANSSAFQDRSHWQQYQIGAFAYSSVNTFPTCNWAAGTPSCAFNDYFFSAGKLRTGTYTAKYVFLASNYKTVSARTVTAKLSVIQKTDAAFGASNGAIDLNVILVGTQNITDAQTDKGKANLNALFQHVYDHYNQTNVGVKLGTIRAYKASTCDDGNAYANVSVNSLGTMFKELSTALPAAIEGTALNIMMVSSIPYTTPNQTILGVAGGINGPPVHGTLGSGLAFSSFNQLATFNSECVGGEVCTLAKQQASFVDMGSTISHEMGHYLGLNHPSESAGTKHDPIADTPECTTGGTAITHSSCLAGMACSAACPGYNSTTTFCAAATQCQFNHVMWYTTKNFNTTSDTGDGNIFSADSSRIINYNPTIQ